MIWPLRYSTIVEHGRCAKGSSSGFGVAKVLVAIMSPPKTELLFSLFSGLRRAGVADGFNRAHFEDRAGVALGADALDDHLLTYMFGKALHREPYSVEVCDHFEVSIVHQNELFILLIHATRQRRLTLRHLLLLCVLALSVLSVCYRCRVRDDPRGEDGANHDGLGDCLPHGLPFTKPKQLRCQSAHPLATIRYDDGICNSQ